MSQGTQDTKVQKGKMNSSEKQIVANLFVSGPFHGQSENVTSIK